MNSFKVNVVILLKIDDTDRKILELLTQDGRMSYAEIGKELNLSRVSVRERVNQMRKAGVIEKFSVVEAI
jgi:Lrp/AsnC family transcriptional regulator, leucine-responsive regulatory protein